MNLVKITIIVKFRFPRYFSCHGNNRWGMLLQGIYDHPLYTKQRNAVVLCQFLFRKVTQIFFNLQPSIFLSCSSPPFTSPFFLIFFNGNLSCWKLNSYSQSPSASALVGSIQKASLGTHLNYVSSVQGRTVETDRGESGPIFVAFLLGFMH